MATKIGQTLANASNRLFELRSDRMYYVCEQRKQIYAAWANMYAVKIALCDQNISWYQNTFNNLITRVRNGKTV